MENKAWVDCYPEGVKPDISDLRYKSLSDLIRESVHGNEKKIAFTQCNWNGMNGSLKYSQVDHLSDCFAVYLREVVGLKPGDRVAVQLPNCLSYPVAVFGVFKAGCVLVNTNPLYTPREMEHQFCDSGAEALIIIDMFADRLTEILSRTSIKKVITAKVGEFFPPVVAGVIRIVQKFWDRTLPPIDVQHTPFRSALDEGAEILRDKGQKASVELLEKYIETIDHSSLAALQYTGGTTGVSKGAMLSHGNLLSNTEQMLEMAGQHIRPGKETIMTALPLYHIFAFTVALLGFYCTGNRNILIPSPRPPSNLKRPFENYKITWLPGVNTLFNALLNERWFMEHPPRHLFASVAGGMALHASVAEKWEEVTGTPVVEGYGLSESSPVLTFNPLGGYSKPGSIGIPVPSTELKCVDDNGNPVAPGEPGEIIAKGPQIMMGYWQKEEETANSLRDGWLYTGDIATMDEKGYFTIVDRKKDMILVSGFNVYPNEIEEVIAQHPKVSEAGVIGVEDPASGEVVHAHVVRLDESLTAEEIIAHCRKSLARYKIPKKVFFREELPKSLIGKIMRKDLRAEVKDSSIPSSSAITDKTEQSKQAQASGS